MPANKETKLFFSRLLYVAGGVIAAYYLFMTPLFVAGFYRERVQFSSYIWQQNVVGLLIGLLWAFERVRVRRWMFPALVVAGGALSYGCTSAYLRMQGGVQSFGLLPAMAYLFTSAFVLMPGFMLFACSRFDSWEACRYESHDDEIKRSKAKPSLALDSNLLKILSRLFLEPLGMRRRS